MAGSAVDLRCVCASAPHCGARMADLFFAPWSDRKTAVGPTPDEDRRPVPMASVNKAPSHAQNREGADQQRATTMIIVLTLLMRIGRDDGTTSTMVIMPRSSCARM